MKKILPVLIFSLSLITFTLVLPRQVHASGTLYFSPGSGIKYNGQNFTVSLRASGMDNVDAVKAVFTFPTDKLTFVSINSGSSAWGIKAQETVSGGTIEIDRGNIGNLSGDKLVAYVTFRPRTNSGTATLAFTGDCALTLAGANVLSGKTNATYSLADAPPPPPAPVADTTPPVISAITVTNVSVNAATINWTTNEASSSFVDYGETTNYFFTASKGDLVTSHSIALDSRFLKAGTTYHFLVRSLDGSGNQVKAADQTFTTIGYDITLTITDTSGNPVGNSTVTLHSDTKTAMTDKKGVVTFKNVTAGEHVVLVTIGDQELASTIVVKDAGVKQVTAKDSSGKVTSTLKTEPQQFNVKIAAASIQLKPLQTIGAILILIGIVLMAIVSFIYRRRKAKQNTPK